MIRIPGSPAIFVFYCNVQAQTRQTKGLINSAPE